jgi:hypothetical protein
MRQKGHPAWLIVGLMYIGLVSSVDAGLVVHYADNLRELNPIAAWLIRGRDVSVLIGCKMFGTLLVTLIVLSLYGHRPAWAGWVTAAIALFQTALLVFLFSPAFPS